MKHLLNISLRVDGKEFIQSNYIELLPFSRTSLRTIIFKNVKIVNNNLDFLSGKYEFCISFKDKNHLSNENQWYEMDMIFSDFFTLKIKDGCDICIKSIISHDKHFFYEQDIIDIYNFWQNDQKLNWDFFDLEFKYSYITACYYWSKLPKKFIQEEIIIDMVLINEQIDLLYYLTKEMFGERAYCGADFHQFEDCISTLCNCKIQLLPKIKFINSNRVLDNQTRIDFDYINDFLVEKGFSIKKL